MRVQAYIELDTQIRTEAQEEVFNQFCSSYLLDYYRIGTSGDREYYHCIITNVDNLPTMLSIMSGRNPVVNGCWCDDGTPYNNGATYTFDLQLHLEYTPDEVTLEQIGGDKFNEIVTPVTSFKPLHGFAGWGLVTEY